MHTPADRKKALATIPKVARPRKDPFMVETAADASLAQKQSALTALLRLSDRIRHYGAARTQRFLALDCRVTRSLVLNL